LRVLCYHSISDLSGSPVIHDYGVPPDQFRRQIEIIKQAGLTFIDSAEFLRFLREESGLSQRGVLLTFDDCYQDLLDCALPILEEQRCPAVAFAVTMRLGMTNDWDKILGAPQLPLLDANGLKILAKSGITIGSHSRTHAKLTKVSADVLYQEITGSLADLQAIGLDCPSFYAYPYGLYNENVMKAVHEAGLKSAFTVKPNLVQPGQDPYQVPRIEILRGDVGSRFLRKVLHAPEVLSD